MFATPPQKRDGTITSYANMSFENQVNKEKKGEVADDIENDGEKEEETIEVDNSSDNESEEEYSIEENGDEKCL